MGASELPVGVVEWVGTVAGPGAEVVRVRCLRGATTSRVHAIDLDSPSGRRRLLLRRYIRPEVLAAEPDAVTGEATVLETLTSGLVAAPRLVAIDPHAEHCDVPALLMTRLPGRPRQHPVDRHRFLDQLAAQLPAIHETPIRHSPGFPAYRPYYRGRRFSPPPWTRRPWAWERAIECHARPTPPHASVLLHRDYHAGNILWRGLTLSGIVDWAWSCRGPGSVDVAHCRLNLALRLGTEAAEQFLRYWQTHAGTQTYDRSWDLIDAVDAPPDVRDTQAALARLDRFVEHAALAAG